MTNNELITAFTRAVAHDLRKRMPVNTVNLREKSPLQQFIYVNLTTSTTTIWLYITDEILNICEYYTKTKVLFMCELADPATTPENISQKLIKHFNWPENPHQTQ